MDVPNTDDYIRNSMRLSFIDCNYSSLAIKAALNFLHTSQPV